MDLYLGLGSNLGDRKANLLRAVGLLDKLIPGRRTALSEFVENPAEGFEGPDFLNAVALWEVEPPCGTETFALEILGICKRVEQVKDAVKDVPGVLDVEVELVFEPVWDKSRMSEEALVELGLDED